jgi:hypothetical protein
MDDSTLIQWLFENGGPAIRYRTATELMDASADPDLDALAADLTSSSMVRQWLDRIDQPGGMTSLHASDPAAFENVCAKLCELGLRAGMLAELDNMMLPFRRHLANWNETWSPVLLASCLNWFGYDDEAVLGCLSERLEAMYRLARSGDYDIYVDQDTFGDFPSAFRKRPLVNPDFYDSLPSIWDIYALAHWPQALGTDQTQPKIEAIIAYILHPDYQALEEGYGVMRAGKRRYYSMGWSVHLPGYGLPYQADGPELDRPVHEAMYVQRLELMAHFSVARQSQWFQDNIRHLQTRRTKEGPYRFPASYLREGSSGYWVLGAYTRLEENRRMRRSLDLDSTFRMCVIESLARGKKR